MIYTDKQFSITNRQLEKLQTALDSATKRHSDQLWLKQVEIDALKSQISDLESELAEYNFLKSGQVSFSKGYALEEMPHILVQARIASGLSQTDLARKLDLKPQQIQRYESTSYMGASLARLIKVSRALGVKASGSFEGPKHVGGSIFSWADVDHIVWSRFPYNEMIKRKWFDVPHGSNPVEGVKKYFLRVAGPQFATAFHRKKVHSGNVPNEFSLLAWQARVLECAHHMEEQGKIAEFVLDDQWLPELTKLTKKRNGPKLAASLLAKNGIALIIEHHFPGTYLDGAAMLSDSGRPVIGLTQRHDRLDNFWFVLLHELGHVFLHLHDGLKFDFFDEENVGDSDSIEAAADKFALDTLIPENLWNQCLSRFALSEEAVNIDAENLGIHPSIIAGRIRRECGDYTILKNLIGQGKVKSQFKKNSNDFD